MKNLKIVREAHGLSQMQLAKLLEISKSTVNNWENGDRQAPFEAMARLAQHLGFSLDDFAFTDMEVAGIGGDKGAGQLNYLVKASDFPTYCTSNNSRFYTKVLIPGLVGEARTFEIATDCMVPLFNFSDWAVCTPIENTKNLEAGQVFVVVTSSSDVVVGYGQSYRDGVKVTPHNMVCPWQIIPYQQVFEVWQVKLRITKYFMMPYLTGELGGAKANEPAEEKYKKGG